MAKMGRPQKKVSWSDIDKLIKIQCTQQEIADFCQVSVDTVDRRCKEEQGVTFAEYFKEKKSAGNISLRRAQWKKGVEKLDGPMLKHLGENYLGQTSKNRHEMTGLDGGPIETADKTADLKIEELDERIRLKQESIRKLSEGTE